MANNKPNILVFIPHDLGDCLHCYDHDDVCSENLDCLAENGVRFTNYFATAPECTASRASMLTGLYAHQNGLMGLANLGWNLRRPENHLAARMRDNGYETHLFGIQHETADHAEVLGYNDVNTNNSGAGAVCDSVIDFLRDNKNSDSPWFLHAGFKDVHRPWPENTTFSPDDVKLPQYLPDTAEIRNDFALFYQNIMDMDAAIGRVIDELDRLDLRKNTLIIFTTDHGSPFPRAKATFYDPGIRIPLIMSHPNLSREKTVSALCSNLDFSPTVLDFCGFQVPSDIEGISMMPLLETEADSLHTEIFGAMYYDVSYDPIYYVRSKNFKYIRSFGVDPQEAAGADPAVLASFKAGQWIRFDDYDVMSSPAWKSMEHSCPLPPKEELYDLKNDPLELNNLAMDPGHMEEIEKMRKQLHGMLRKTNAPLPDNHVPPSPEQIAASKRYGKILHLNRK